MRLLIISISQTRVAEVPDFGGYPTKNGSQGLPLPLTGCGFIFGFRCTDYVDCGKGASLTAIGNQVTLEAWIKPAGVGWGIIAGVSRSGNNTYDLAFSPEQLIDWCLWNGNKETWPFHSQSQLNLDEWHHIIGFYNGSEVRIYINGVVDNKQEFSGELQHNGENFLIGTRTSDNLHFNGVIDEVRIYNRALSDGEIIKNMNSKGLTVDFKKRLTLTWGAIKLALD